MNHQFFQLGVSAPEKIFRTVLIYGLLVVAFRIFGKRELGQMNTLDLIVLILVANAVQNGIIGDDVSVTGAAIGAVTLLLLNYLFNFLTYRSTFFRRLLEGTSTTLIERGRINRQTLRREQISLPELRSLARHQGFENLDEVDRAILETNGAVSMFKKNER